jgi:hypothetical protein
MTELASGRGQPRPGRWYRNRGSADQAVRSPPCRIGALAGCGEAPLHVRLTNGGADMEEERDPVPLAGRAGVATSRIPFDEEPGVRPGVAVGLQ